VSGLRTRLVLVALIAAVPVLGLIALGQLSTRRQIHERTADDGVRLIRLAASQQASWFNGVHRLLQTLARFPNLRTGPIDECNAELAAVLEDHPGYVNLAVIAADGRVRCSSNPRTVALRLDDRAWFRPTLHATGTLAGAFPIGRRTGHAAVVVAPP